MIRTRDFVLVLLTIGFIAMAVGITSFAAFWGQVTSLGGYIVESVSLETDYVGEVPTESDPRSERVATLRAKIAERLGAAEATPPPVPTPVVVASTTPATTPTSTVATVETCAWHAPLVINWQPGVITQENREGMRVYSEPGIPVIDPVTQLSQATEVVRARILLRTWPSDNPSCLPSDVIGIALDGSLIRNNEAALYTVFGGDTLIGYALDGFPIYGVSPQVATDRCGGATIGGTYRYVLDGERPGLISCFAGSPITLQ